MANKRGGIVLVATMQFQLPVQGVNRRPHGGVASRKYVATIAWLSLLSLFLNGTRVPMETTDKIGQRTSPLG